MRHKALKIKTFFSAYRYDLWKIFGVAVFVFLALTIKVDSVGETDEVVQFDYLYAELEIA
jgi:hypothetical protein